MKKLSIVKTIGGLAVMAAVFCGTAFSSLAAEGKITAETAKIRANASTDSEVVGSTVKGKTIDILEAVKDSSGTVWYKVAIADGGYGYIRSDLVQTSETIEVSTQTSSSSTQTASQPAETVPTSIGEQQAVVKSGNNANVRSGASTQHSVVVSLPAGTSVTLIGEANDSAGNKWYQLTCSYNGRTVEGYVREDLLTIGAGEAPAENGAEGGEGQDPSQSENPEDAASEEGGEAPAPDEEHNDYKVVYTANDAGVQDYYLFLPGGESMISVPNLLNAYDVATQSVQEQQKLQDQLDKEKIVIIILAVVIVLLFIVITVLLFKIRSLYYEDYEDEEEEEEEEEEPAPVRKKVKKRAAEEEEESAPAPVKKKRPAPSDDYERQAKPREKSGQPKAKGEKELHAAERKEPEKKPEKKPASRKPQNFLIDDDEFEFEFLNMDDKDL